MVYANSSSSQEGVKPQYDSDGKSKTTKIWNDYDRVLNFKKQINLIEKIYKNDKFYSGDQWYKLEGKMADLPKIVMNVVKQISDYKQSQILSEDLTFLYVPQDYTTEDKEDKSSDLTKASNAYNSFAMKLKQSMNLDNLNTHAVHNAKLTGGGGTFFYWDSNVKTGNKIKSVGDVRAFNFDSSNYFPCDPTNIDVQTQDWIIISGRESVNKLKAEAKRNKIRKEDIKKIVSDKDTDKEAYEYDKISQNNNDNKATILMKLYRNEETGTIMYSKSTKCVEIVKDIDTGLSLYPLAWMNWEYKKASAFGTSEIEAIIPNQVALNKLLSFGLRSTSLMGFPKMIVNKNKVTGNVTNSIGGIVKVNTEDVRGAITYLNPPQSSNELYKLFDTILAQTKNINGANTNALGEGSARNASAIVALQKQTQIPLDFVKKNYKEYLKQVANIFLEFFKKQYTEMRAVVVTNDKDKTTSMDKFRGSDFAEFNFDVVIDIGVSSRYSEVLVLEQLQMYLDSGNISFKQYLDYIPQGVFPAKERLIQEVEAKDELGQIEDELIQSILPQLPPEMQEELSGIEDQQEAKIVAMQMITEFIGNQVQQQVPNPEMMQPTPGMPPTGLEGTQQII